MDNENTNMDESKFRQILQRNVTERLSSVGKELMDFRANFQQSAQGIIDNVSQILTGVEESCLEQLREEVAALESGVRSRIEPEVRQRIETEVRQTVEAEFEDRLSAARRTGADGAMASLSSKLE